MWPTKHEQGPAGQAHDTRVLSLLHHEEVQSIGRLPLEAILGVYTGPTNSVESFRPNRVFVDFLHRVFAEQSSHGSDLVAAARKQRNGWVYVIDPRCPDPRGPVMPEDIFGAFEVRDGELVPGSYRGNGEYRVLTANGMTQLTESQRAAFRLALTRDL